MTRSSQDPDDLPVGARVVAADDLAIGDLVWFDTTQRNVVLIRKVRGGGHPSCVQLFRVDAGDTDDARLFTKVPTPS
jgi:hypothetical protein